MRHLKYVKLAVGHWNIFSLLQDTNFFDVEHWVVVSYSKEKKRAMSNISGVSHSKIFLLFTMYTVLSSNSGKQ